MHSGGKFYCKYKKYYCSVSHIKTGVKTLDINHIQYSLLVERSVQQ